MRNRLTASIAMVLLVCAGPACSTLRPKPPLVHHATLEIDATVPNREAAARETVAVIERRLTLIGISNFEVKLLGSPADGRILVTVADVPGAERVKNVLLTPVRLELVAVVSPPSPTPVRTFDTKEDAVASLGETVPPNRKVLQYAEIDMPTAGDLTPEGSQKPRQWVVVEWPPVVNTREFSHAKAKQGFGDRDYSIEFTLKPAGAERFGAWTEANINQYMAVVLNDEVKSTAFIKSQIFDHGEFPGGFTKESAEDLALILTSGPLPAPVKIVSQGVSK